MKELIIFMLKMILIIIVVLYALTFVIFTIVILAKTIRYMIEKKRSTQQEPTSGTYVLDNSNNTFSVQTSEEVNCEECVWQREEIFSKQKVCPVNSDLGLDGQSCNKGIRK